jgi:hypothetical protein
MDLAEALERLIHTECDTITVYGQARHPLTGREQSWTVTLITNQSKRAHLKRVGEGATVTEALCAALAEEGTTVADHAKRRSHRNSLGLEGIPAKYQGKTFKKALRSRLLY